MSASEGTDVSDEQAESKVAKVAGLLAAAGAAWLAGKLIDRVWSMAFGHTAPKPEDGGVRFAEIAAAAAISGALIGLLRATATHGAKKLVHH